MPNRILREGILTSARVDSLSESAELFYRRLHSRVDDYGRYEAHPELLRSSCYPLRVDRVKARHIISWLADCEKAGLLVVYKAGSKTYLQILDWRQQERSASKYPPPDTHLIANASKCEQEISDAHLVVDVDVGVVEGGKSTVGLKPDALLVLQFLNEKTGRYYKPRPSNLKLIEARLRDGATVDDCRAVIAKKCREWAGKPEMDLYLRPKTLFNATNFAQYEGELT